MVPLRVLDPARRRRRVADCRRRYKLTPKSAREAAV
jgi:hypothetical protein